MDTFPQRLVSKKDTSNNVTGMGDAGKWNRKREINGVRIGR